MRQPASLRTVLWRVGAAAAFVTALSFAPIRAFAPWFAAQSAAPTSPKGAAPTTAAATDLATILPDKAVAALEGHGLGAIARGFLTSDVHARLVAMESFRKFEKTPEYAQLLAGLSFTQLASGLKPTDLAAALLGDEVVAALVVDGSLPGLVAAVRIGDADVADQMVRAARSFGQMDKEAAVKPREFSHRDATGVVLNDKLWLASVGGDLVAASSEALVNAAIDRDLDGGTAAAPKLVVQMRQRSSPKSGAQLRVALDLPAAAALKPDHMLLPEKSDNAAAALLLGDLLAAARQADVVVAELELDGTRARLALRIPVAFDQLPASVRSFGHARAQEPLLALAPKNTLATLSLRRDYSQFWEDRGELCDAKTEKDFAEMKTNLGLFFGGRNLPDEILPKLDDEILFVLTRQTYPGVKDPPKVRFPAGAFVWKTKGDAAKLGQQFAIGVNTFIGIFNADGAQKRVTPLLPFVEPFEGVTVYGGRALADDDRPADPARQNVAPAVAWVGDRIVLASSEELLHDLIRILKSDPAALAKSSSVAAGCTGSLRFEGGAIAEILRENREALVSNAVLNDGKPRDKAELEQALLVEVANQVDHARLVEIVAKDALELALDVQLTPAAPVAPATPGARTEGS
jgi:hypothetical protein